MKDVMAGLQQTNSEKILLSWVRQNTRQYPQVCSLCCTFTFIHKPRADTSDSLTLCFDSSLTSTPQNSSFLPPIPLLTGCSLNKTPFWRMQMLCALIWCWHSWRLTVNAVVSFRHLSGRLVRSVWEECELLLLLWRHLRPCLPPRHNKRQKGAATGRDRLPIIAFSV